MKEEGFIEINFFDCLYKIIAIISFNEKYEQYKLFSINKNEVMTNDVDDIKQLSWMEFCTNQELLKCSDFYLILKTLIKIEFSIRKQFFLLKKYKIQLKEYLLKNKIP